MENNLNCKNCGAPLTGSVCSYCGTRYDLVRKGHEIVKIVEVMPPQAIVLGAEGRIPHHELMVGPREMMVNYVKRDLAYSLAERLLEENLISFHTCDDMETCSTRIRARLRAIKSDYLFS